MNTPALAGWASGEPIGRNARTYARARALTQACTHGPYGKQCVDCAEALANGTVGDYTPTDARPQYTTHDEEGNAMAKAYGRRQLTPGTYPSEAGLYAWEAYRGQVIPVYRKPGRRGLYVTPPIGNAVEIAVTPTIAAGWERYALDSGHAVEAVRVEAGGTLTFDVVHARVTAWHDADTVRLCYCVSAWDGMGWQRRQDELVKAMNAASEAVKSQWSRRALKAGA